MSTHMEPEGALLDVGVIGFGTIGRRVVDALIRGIPGLRLRAINVRSDESAQRVRDQFGAEGPEITTTELHSSCDILVDCAPSGAFGEMARSALEAGRTVVTVNGTALLLEPDLRDLAERHGARLLLVSGGILGLDAVRAAAEDEISTVKIVTRKPPQSLASSPRMHELGLNAAELTEPLLIFSGSVREGAKLFPANVNVAAAVALAGIGADRTILEVWADPAVNRNIHDVHVEADSARFSMSIENVPTLTNPATGRIAALSVIAALRRFGEPLQVGS
jgi:aspartate dehydrogenase